MISYNALCVLKPAVNFAGKGKVSYFDNNRNKLLDDKKATYIKIEAGNDEIPDKIGKEDVDVTMSGGETDIIIGNKITVRGNAKVKNAQAEILLRAFENGAITNKAESKEMMMLDSNSRIKNLETQFLDTFKEALVTGNAIVHGETNMSDSSKINNITSEYLIMQGSSEITGVANVKEQMEMNNRSKALNVTAKTFVDNRTEKTQEAHPVNLQEWKIGENNDKC